MMISLTNVEHMHYLYSCVKEDVNNALDAVINDNFIIAWNILISRYDNKRRLITIFTIVFQFTIAHDRKLQRTFVRFAIKSIKRYKP